MEQVVKEEPLTLTDILRARSKGVVNQVAAFFMRLGFTPNLVTLLGLLGNVIGAYFLATGQITLGGVIILLMGPFDALDGAIARLGGKQTKFGAFLDSVTDRLSELVIFGGLLIYYTHQNDALASILVYAAAAGSLMVSYTRARAQSVGLEAKVGILSRVERFLILAPCLVINRPIIALWILAVLANFTAVQRILHVRKAAEQEPPDVHDRQA